MALVLKGTGLATDEGRPARIAEKSIDSEKFLALLFWIFVCTPPASLSLETLHWTSRLDHVYVNLQEY
jgi:hypothetical protein